jgi:CarD family transcriptional regulator
MAGRLVAVFQVNDVIVYGTQGVCRITGTEEKVISGKRKTYFILKPVEDNGSTIFVPTDNEVVLGKMRRLLTKEEIHKLIDSMRQDDAVWVENENERKVLYKHILANGEHLELIKMIQAIYAHKKEREAEGKRLHMSDEHFFKEAEQLLYKEFQYVMELHSKDELMAYIFKRLEKQDT